jgi:Na+/proline symporter
MTTSGMGNTAKSDFKWQQVVTAVAAAAGGAAWVSAVGSGVVALRLREADLPIEPVVALMSTEHRFAIGAGILAAPLLAGSIGFLADTVLTTKDRVIQHHGEPRLDKQIRRLRQGLAVVTVVFGLVLVYYILRPPPETLVLEGLAVVAAVAIALEILPDDGDKRHGFEERLAIFLAVLVGAGVGAIIAESFKSPTFDEARITIRDHSVITGAYITSTDHAVVLSTRCEVIEAVPRDRIERIRVGPGEVKRAHC